MIRHIGNHFKKKRTAEKNAIERYNRMYTDPAGTDSSDGKSNMILSKDISMSLDEGFTLRSSDTIAIGNAQDIREHLIEPNIMQANGSYIIMGRGDGLYRKYSAYLKHLGYRIRCFDLYDTERSTNHYNPIEYIDSEWDAHTLAGALISNTDNKADHDPSDPFPEMCEYFLLCAVTAYVRFYGTSGKKNLLAVTDLLNGDGGSALQRLDALFEKPGETDPESFSFKMYSRFRTSSGKAAETVVRLCAERLCVLNSPEIKELTAFDDIGLDSIGDEKTAVFIMLPETKTECSFLAPVMVSQFLERSREYYEKTSAFSSLVVDRNGEIVKCFRASSAEDAVSKKKKAQDFFETAKNGTIRYNSVSGLYEIVVAGSGVIAYRGSADLAGEKLEAIKKGTVLGPERRGNKWRLPVHTTIILDEYIETGIVPDLENTMTVKKKRGLSMIISVNSIKQLQKTHRDCWSTMAGNCGNIVVCGDSHKNIDEETAEWICRLVSLNNERRKEIFPDSMRVSGRKIKKKWFMTLPKDRCVLVLSSIDSLFLKKYDISEHPGYALLKETSGY